MSVERGESKKFYIGVLVAFIGAVFGWLFLVLDRAIAEPETEKVESVAKEYPKWVGKLWVGEKDGSKVEFLFDPVARNSVFIDGLLQGPIELSAADWWSNPLQGQLNCRDHGHEAGWATLTFNDVNQIVMKVTKVKHPYTVIFSMPSTTVSKEKKVLSEPSTTSTEYRHKRHPVPGRTPEIGGNIRLAYFARDPRQYRSGSIYISSLIKKTCLPPNDVKRKRQTGQKNTTGSQPFASNFSADFGSVCLH